MGKNDRSAFPIAKKKSGEKEIRMGLIGHIYFIIIIYNFT
jgi:hypothetical protein